MLRVELVAGPGTGKSTTRAMVFGDLKQRGHNAEEDPEVAKALTWEKRWTALGFQPYIFGKQAYYAERVKNDVDVHITDTSVLLSLIYKPNPLPSWYPSFERFVLDYHQSTNPLLFFLERDPSRGYNPKGRRQSEESAMEADRNIRAMLDTNRVPYVPVKMDVKDNYHVAQIVAEIEKRLA